MMRKLLYGLIGVIPFLVHSSSLAQKKFAITNFTTDNGLPQNTVRDFHFDDAGFLWIATENGLVRFDGSLFKLFSPPEARNLDSRIVSLNYSAERRIFVTDINSSVAEIKTGRLNHRVTGRTGQIPDLDEILGSQLAYPLFEKLRNSHFIDRRNNNDLLGLIPLAGQRWTLVFNHRLEIYKDTTLQLSCPYPSTHDYHVFKIENQLVIFAPQTGFYRYDLSHNTWVRLNNATGFHNLKSEDVIWDYQQSLPVVVYKKQAFSLKTVNNTLYSTLLIDSLVNLSKVNRLEYNPMWDMYVVGTESEGLFIYREIHFRHMTVTDKHKAYYGQYPLNENTVVTNNGDIIRAGPGSPVQPFIPKFNNYIVTGTDQTIYYASGDTVFGYSKKTATTQRLFTSPHSQMFVFDYNRDTLWMINANGIFFHTNTQTDTSLLFSRAMNNQPYAVVRIAPGKLLYGDCLGLFTYETASHNIDTVLWSPQKCVRTLWQYGTKMFVGTYGDGWKVWDGKKIINMPEDRDQFLRYAHCFIKDRNNYLWIPTNRGLFKFYMPDVEQYLAGTITSLYFYHYGKAEGIEHTEFNGGCYPCAVQLQNGYTSLPNLAGLVWFNPEETGHSNPVAAIVFDKLEVNNKPIPPGNGLLTLPAGVRLFRIELSSPYFGSAENSLIEYRTFGVDTTWKILKRDNPVIRFTTLPFGHYRIEIRMLQGFGKGYYIKSFPFNVEPPWYLAPLALVGWAVLLVLTVLLIIRIRVAQYRRTQKRLKKLVEEKVAELRVVNKKLEQNVEMLEGYQQELLRRDTHKTRFIKIMSHDLMGPLRFVKMVTGQIERQQEQMDKKSLLEILADIQTTADDLLALCTDLLNWSTYEKGAVHLTYDYFDLHPVVEEKVSLFMKVALTKKIRLISHCPEYMLIENDRNVIKIILHNLLSNAIKFTKEGEVNVFAGYYDGRYFVGVSDTGRGMTHQQVHELMHNNIIISTIDTDNKKGHGIGFLIIRELIAATKGELIIQSTPGIGTTITIEWPVRTPRSAGVSKSEEKLPEQAG